MKVEISVKDLAVLVLDAAESCRKSMKFGYNEEVVEKGCWWKFKKDKVKKVPLSVEEFGKVVASTEPFKSVIGLPVLLRKGDYTEQVVLVDADLLATLYLYAEEG